MADTHILDRVWELMDGMSICMLTTHDGDELRSRPMRAMPRRQENAVYFLADARRHKEIEIRGNPNVNLAFADARGQKYVSVAGHAQVMNDRSRIAELWSTPAKAWWSDPKDPNIRVLKVVPRDAEYWDSPGTVMSYVKMFAAAATGTRPAMGENRKVSM
jgi:general stress protein 26